MTSRASDIDNARTESVVHVWDRTTRLFHWVNFLCVLGLICVGTVILYAGDLAIPNDGKIALKRLHVWIGYAFLVNLTWRLIWGFIGNAYARWSAVLPGGKGYVSALKSSIRNVLSRDPEPHAGHSPLGRIAVTLLLLALFVQGISGILLAGTDVFMPPFGDYFAEWVATPNKDPSLVQPYAPETVNEVSYAEMREFRSPIIATHLNTYYALLALILIHVIAVVTIEIRKGGNIISAMFSGRKSLPEDLRSEKESVN
ncbi:MAG: cytochrome b/b6 domain-containing protein [Pseudomonadales bacterium]|nr:cytochrome b/b6 domain-containing protein [Pseudomonadales bacterium]